MNRRGFLGALLAAPAAAAAVAAGIKAKPPSTLSLAQYEWKSVFDGFAISEEMLNAPAPDFIVCSNEFHSYYQEALRKGEADKARVRSLRRLSREGSPQARRRAFEKLREIKHPAESVFTAEQLAYAGRVAIETYLGA